jgi:two-component system, cell cycle sensor histidine kinase PleC
MSVGAYKSATPAEAFALAWASLRPDLSPRTPEETRVAAIKLRVALDSLNFGLSMMPPSVVAMAALYTYWMPWTYAFGWAAFCIVLWFPAWQTAKRLADSEAIFDRASIQDVCARIATFMFAFGWQGVLFWVPGDPYNNLAITVILVGSSVGAVMTAVWVPISLLQMIFYLGVVMAMGFGTGGVPAYVSCLSFIFGPFLLGVIANIHAQTSRLLFLEDHKDKLIADLQASNRAKSDFLANMSHELRTPMNAILGFSEVIKEEVMGPNHQPLYKSYAADIHASGSHLLGLINDILDLSKIEAGKFELNESVIDIHDIVEGTKRIISLKAAQKGVTLINEIPQGLMIFADASAMRQVSLNLASNALKFTPRGGSIRCYLTQTNGQYAIVTEDTGCGIRPEDLTRVFESFGQGRHDVASADKGTGLGLPIVRGLIRAHGGDVWIVSDLGKGTKVFATLDLARIREVPNALLQAFGIKAA